MRRSFQLLRKRTTTFVRLRNRHAAKRYLTRSHTLAGETRFIPEKYRNYSLTHSGAFVSCGSGQRDRTNAPRNPRCDRVYIMNQSRCSLLIKDVQNILHLFHHHEAAAGKRPMFSEQIVSRSRSLYRWIIAQKYCTPHFSDDT